MFELNEYRVLGRLTHDPELRRIPSGKAITTLRLVSNRRWKDKDGEKKEDSLFLDVDVWDKDAEYAAQNYKKGDEIYVKGSLKMDTWDDKKTGEKRQKIKVQADPFGIKKNWQKGETSGAAVPDAAPASTPTDGPVAGAGGNPVDEDEIPF